MCKKSLYILAKELDNHNLNKFLEKTLYYTGKVIEAQKLYYYEFIHR